MNDAFLRLIELTKRYRDRAVVANLSLDVAEGEVVALLGASGCGKTTTLRLMAGLETPDAGEIIIGGERVAADGRSLAPPAARGIGFVFQDLALWPHLTVAGNLDFVLASNSMLRRERAKRISEVLQLARIERFAHSYPAELSGGEQQRAALARAIVSHPRLLLLDEPMSSLDANLKDDLLGEFAALQRALGVATIYVTHDKAEAFRLAHRVAVMNDGRIEQVDTPERLRAHPASEAVARFLRPSPKEI